MRRRHLLYLLYTSSVRPPSSTISFFNAPPPLPSPFLIHKVYSHESSQRTHVDDTISHERAPSTLEEFKRLEEEKASQGFASQTEEKAEDGFMEAATGDNNVDSVKESFKEPVGVGNFHHTGDE
uniref:uncharacterized protein LOC122579778 n=1 Tax=Erigeron canadensis TaxID=72917 RepID=UPI001CB92442|nr:uncharacterized protein LOC122579778 [Erigeron canadensis]